MTSATPKTQNKQQANPSQNSGTHVLRLLETPSSCLTPTAVPFQIWKYPCGSELVSRQAFDTGPAFHTVSTLESTMTPNRNVTGQDTSVRRNSSIVQADLFLKKKKSNLVPFMHKQKLEQEFQFSRLIHVWWFKPPESIISSSPGGETACACLKTGEQIACLKRWNFTASRTNKI